MGTLESDDQTPVANSPALLLYIKKL